MAEKPVKVEIVGDSSKYKKALGEAEDASGKFATKTEGHGKLVAAAAIGAGAAVGAFAADIVGSASDYNETLSKTKIIFGEGSDAVIKFAEDAASNLGLSAQAALDAQANFAIFGQGAGLAGDELTGFSADLTTLAADLGSFHNTSPEQAIEAIGAALRGEAEPIRAYGILLDDATLKQAALELGIYDGVGALTQQEKVLGAQKAIMDQSEVAAGDFAETSAGLAGQTKILAAEFENLKVKLGSKLIPFVIEAVGLFKDFAVGGDAAKESFKKLADELDPTNPAEVANAFAQLVIETQNARSMMDNARHGVGDFFAQLGDGTLLTSTEDLRNMTKAFGDLRERSPESAQAVVDALRTVVSAAENGSEKAKEYVAALDLTDEVLNDLQATLPHVESATLDATSGFEHMALAGHDVGIKVAEASAALGEAARQAGQAKRDTDNLAASWELLKGTLSDQQSWIDVQNSFADVKAAGEEAFQAAADHTADADQKARDYQSALIGLKQKVIDYGAEVGGLPPEMVTKILADIDDGSIANAEQLLEHLKRTRTVIYNAQVAGHREFDVPQGAEGGLVKARPGGTLVNVGEAGHDELLIPLNDKHGASGTSNTYNVTVQMPVGSNGDDVVRAIKKFEGRNGPGWRAGPSAVSGGTP